jgi:hypothetical protein
MILAGIFPPTIAAQVDPVFELLGRIDALRRQNGLAPLAFNDQLAASAQRHSRDMADTGRVDHTGSDGSSIEQRIAASGYGGENGYSAWGENIYGGGLAGIDAAWTFWTNSSVHRNNLLSERYREIGIGVATSENGTYYTLNFGASPGVLPFFVDQGGLLVARDVTLTLSNEETQPGGSNGQLGRAVEVRVGEGEDLSGVEWQPWQRTIPLTLSNVAGAHRITVEYRDANGSTASFFRVVTLDIDTSAAQPTATPVSPTVTASDIPTSSPSDTPAPASTSTSMPRPSATATVSETSAPLVEPAATTPAATQTPTATPTPTLTLTLTATPIPYNDDPPLESIVTRSWADAPTNLISVISAMSVLAVLMCVVVITRKIRE